MLKAFQGKAQSLPAHRHVLTASLENKLSTKLRIPYVAYDAIWSIDLLRQFLFVLSRSMMCEETSLIYMLRLIYVTKFFRVTHTATSP